MAPDDLEVRGTDAEPSATASITVRGGAQKSAPTKAPAQAKTGKMVETGSRIVVRAAPDSAESLFSLSRGERVRIVAREGQWAQIATADGEGGWIRIK
jgi:SH3-like domain-containing protein